MNIQKKYYTCFCVAMLLIAAGCGGPDLPKPVPVTGTITLDGRPVPDLAVYFGPAGRTRGGGSFGCTDENGKYELITQYNREKGAAVGEYTVSIRPAVKGSSDDTMVMTTTTNTKLPPKLARGIRGLKATVRDNDNVIDFPLSSR